MNIIFLDDLKVDSRKTAKQCVVKSENEVRNLERKLFYRCKTVLRKIRVTDNGIQYIRVSIQLVLIQQIHRRQIWSIRNEIKFNVFDEFLSFIE